MYFPYYRYKKLLTLSICTLFSLGAYAHVIVEELDKLSVGATINNYFQLGFQHIIPAGLDHILFVISLFLLSPKVKNILWQSAAFTLAHSITLGLAMYKVINIPSAIVEPIIAASIAVMAIQNIFFPKAGVKRFALVFAFGLIHGLGFAGSLATLGLPKNSFLMALISFNVGVEVGQLVVILLCFLLVGKWFANKQYYHKYIVTPASIIIALTAIYFTAERLFAS